ncbi:MAG: hypothetical protein QOG04_1491 [Actinomycetota bacterium]|jgi:uncharacterized protein YxjI|nr:hypothetical protein [Actinomycetota bacterium]
MPTLLELNRLFVNQKGKLIELTNEFHIRDEDGNDVGMVREEGQSKAKKVLRFVSQVDQFLTHKYGVYEADGTKILDMVRPAKFVKSRVEVHEAGGRKVGEIVQKNVFGKIRFDLDGSAGTLGQIRAENWRAWDFAIVDAQEKEVARITKKFVGVAKAVFTTADNYIVEIQPEVAGDMRLMVLAAAVGVDTALKQDDKGLSIGNFA